MTLDIRQAISELPPTTKSILDSVFDDVADAASPQVIRVMDRRISELNDKIADRTKRDERYKSMLESVEMAISRLEGKDDPALGVVREMLYGRKGDLERLIANDPIIGYREKRNELQRDRELVLSRARLVREIRATDNG